MKVVNKNNLAQVGHTDSAPPVGATLQVVDANYAPVEQHQFVVVTSKVTTDAGNVLMVTPVSPYTRPSLNDLAGMKKMLNSLGDAFPKVVASV